MYMVFVALCIPIAVLALHLVCKYLYRIDSHKELTRISGLDQLDYHYPKDIDSVQYDRQSIKDNLLAERINAEYKRKCTYR